MKYFAFSLSFRKDITVNMFKYVIFLLLVPILFAGGQHLYVQYDSSHSQRSDDSNFISDFALRFIETVVSVLVLIAICVSIFAIYRQIKQTDEYHKTFNFSVISNMWSNVQSHGRDVLKMINTDKYPYFYSTKDLESDITEVDKNGLYILAEMHADLFEHIIALDNIARKNKELNDGFLDVWLMYILHIYDHSPVLKLYLDKNQDQYSDNMTLWLLDINKQDSDSQEEADNRIKKYKKHFQREI